jgi:hypothetical protein
MEGDFTHDDHVMASQTGVLSVIGIFHQLQTRCAQISGSCKRRLRWRTLAFFFIIRGMALVAFLRGVNVGGHRRFRPSVLARELSHYGVLNVGAAGTLVVRKPGSRTKFRAALLRKLPFEAEIVLCEGRDLVRLETENPFGTSHPPRMLSGS